MLYAFLCAKEAFLLNEQELELPSTGLAKGFVSFQLMVVANVKVKCGRRWRSQSGFYLLIYHLKC